MESHIRNNRPATSFYTSFQLIGELWSETPLNDPLLLNARRIYSKLGFYESKVSSKDNELLTLSFIDGQAIMIWERTQTDTGYAIHLILFINKSFTPNDALIKDGVLIATMLWPNEEIKVEIDPPLISSQNLI